MSDLQKKRAKDEGKDKLLKKKLKVDGDEKEPGQDVDFEACDIDDDKELGFDIDDDESISDDGEVSSDRSEVELDVDAFAKFCKENPMVDDEEGSYDSEEEEDYDSDDELVEVLVNSSDEDENSMDGEMIVADSGSSGDDDSVEDDFEEDPVKKALQEID